MWLPLEQLVSVAMVLYTSRPIVWQHYVHFTRYLQLRREKQNFWCTCGRYNNYYTRADLFQAKVITWPHMIRAPYGKRIVGGTFKMICVCVWCGCGCVGVCECVILKIFNIYVIPSLAAYFYDNCDVCRSQRVPRSLHHRTWPHPQSRGSRYWAPPTHRNHWRDEFKCNNNNNKNPIKAGCHTGFWSRGGKWEK